MVVTDRFHCIDDACQWKGGQCYNCVYLVTYIMWGKPCDDVSIHNDVMTRRRFPHYWPKSLVYFPHKGPVNRSFDVFFAVSLNNHSIRFCNSIQHQSKIRHLGQNMCVRQPLNNFPVYKELTHWGRDKMAAVSQTTLSNAFSWMKMLEFRFKFHLSLFLRVQFTIFQHWFR